MRCNALLSVLGISSLPARGPTLLSRDYRLALLQKMLWCNACVGALADTRKGHDTLGWWSRRKHKNTIQALSFMFQPKPSFWSDLSHIGLLLTLLSNSSGSAG